MFDIINNYNNEIDNIEDLRNYINYVVKDRKIENAIFNIIFVNNEEIKNINKEYRHIDRETDVISFALEDEKDIEYKDFRVLGDIYISVDKAKEQSVSYNHSLFREICFLSTHGILHLLGYDHMKKEDEKIMFSLQEELLNKYGINR